MKIIHLFSLLLIVIFSFCNVSLVDGTGTDAGEAKILLGKVDYKGDAVYKAGVFLHKLHTTEQGKDTDPLFTSTDAQGIYRFSKIPEGTYLIEARIGDSLASMQYSKIYSKDSLTAETMTLSSPVSISATLIINNLPLTRASIKIAGLNHLATSSDNGQFTFSNLPKGSYILLVTDEDGALRFEHAFSFSNDGDSLFVRETPYTILEDFENFEHRNRIGRVLGGGWWYASVDDYPGTISGFDPPLHEGFAAAITTEGSFAGHSFHVNLQVDTTSSEGYALIGTDISGSLEQADLGRTFFDLSRMSAFSFWAKGAGTIHVQFRSRLKNGTITNFTSPVSLSEEWQIQLITNDDIPSVEIDGEFFSWHDGSQAVKSINFMSEEDAEIWLDQIIIEGMTISDFFDAAKR